MVKKPTTPQTHPWAVYHIKGTPAKLVGIIADALDEKTAIERAIILEDIRRAKLFL
jgi:hypothetical protein